MIFVLALGASLANALTSIFQRMGVEDAPASKTLRLSLLTYALHRKVWLLGFALMFVSFGLQAAALHIGRLSEVQPILTTELVFLVIVLAAWFGFPVTRREVIGCLTVTAGLAGFLYFAHPNYGTGLPQTWAWILTAGACTAGIAAAVRARAVAAPSADHLIRYVLVAAAALVLVLVGLAMIARRRLVTTKHARSSR